MQNARFFAFGMRDARAFKSEAITAASKNAVADARTLADATGQKLVRLLEVILDEDAFSSPKNRNFSSIHKLSITVDG